MSRSLFGLPCRSMMTNVQPSGRNPIGTMRRREIKRNKETDVRTARICVPGPTVCDFAPA